MDFLNSTFFSCNTPLCIYRHHLAFFVCYHVIWDKENKCNHDGYPSDCCIKEFCFLSAFIKLGQGNLQVWKNFRSFIFLDTPDYFLHQSCPFWKQQTSWIIVLYVQNMCLIQIIGNHPIKYSFRFYYIICTFKHYRQI